MSVVASGASREDIVRKSNLYDSRAQARVLHKALHQVLGMDRQPLNDAGEAALTKVAFVKCR